jgi:hypothetical protein
VSETRSPDLIQPLVGFRAWTVEAPLPRDMAGAAVRGVLDPVAASRALAARRKEPLTLWSAGMGAARWKPGVARAECRLDEARARGYPGWPRVGGPHEAPHRDCACGFYAHHDLLGVYTSRAGGGDQVIGAIAAWGRIEVHQSGFRAEFAKVVAIALMERQVVGDAEKRAELELLAERYSADCVSVVDLEEAALKHGIRVPEDLLPYAEPEWEEIHTWQSRHPVRRVATSPNFHRGGFVPPAPPLSPHMHPLFGGGQSWISSTAEPGPRSPSGFWQRYLSFYPGYITTWLPAALLFDWSWWVETAIGIVVGLATMIPVFRLALRLRCWWRERWGTFGMLEYHSDPRNRAGNTRCPECGWKFR